MMDISNQLDFGLYSKIMSVVSIIIEWILDWPIFLSSFLEEVVHQQYKLTSLLFV